MSLLLISVQHDKLLFVFLLPEKEAFFLMSHASTDKVYHDTNIKTWVFCVKLTVDCGNWQSFSCLFLSVCKFFSTVFFLGINFISFHLIYHIKLPPCIMFFVLTVNYSIFICVFLFYCFLKRSSRSHSLS